MSTKIRPGWKLSAFKKAIQALNYMANAVGRDREELDPNEDKNPAHNWVNQ